MVEIFKLFSGQGGCVCVEPEGIKCSEGEVAYITSDNEIFCVDPKSVTLADILNGEAEAKKWKEKAQTLAAWKEMPYFFTFKYHEQPVSVAATSKEDGYYLAKTLTFTFENGSKSKASWRSSIKEIPFRSSWLERQFPLVFIDGEEINGNPQMIQEFDSAYQKARGTLIL